MEPEITAAALALFGSLCGTYWANRRASALIAYRLEQLEKKVDKHKCVSCGKCAKACKMDVDVTKNPDHTECIRCGMCIRACPTDAIRFRYGFGEGKETGKAEKAVEAPQNNIP